MTGSVCATFTVVLVSLWLDCVRIAFIVAHTRAQFVPLLLFLVVLVALCVGVVLV